MFTEHKAPGEVQQITKLSQAIRIGALTIPENTSWTGCALGTAARAMGDYSEPPYLFLMGKFPNMSAQHLFSISMMHSKGRSREQIARDLEAQGL